MVLGLQQVSLFSSLPLEEIKHLEAAFPSIDFQPGEIIFEEGKVDDKFYILQEGHVEIIKALGSFGERHLKIGDPGDLLGEMSLFSGDHHHTASVRALTPVHLLQVSHAELDHLLKRRPQFAYNIIGLLSRRLDDSENLTIKELREKNRILQEAYDQLKAAQKQLIEKEKLEKELEITRKIQESILPEALPSFPGYEFGAMMIPARVVGGDFYSFMKLSQNQLGVVVGDVSDKGFHAALFMALCYSLIYSEAVQTESPAQTLYKVNQHLQKMNASRMFVTLVYGILQIDTGEFHYVRAGHPTPLLLDDSGEILEVPFSAGLPLGLFDDTLLDEQCIQIPKGGTLLLYSDGINETADIQGVEFGTESIGQALTQLHSKPAQSICQNLWEKVQTYGKGMPQQDDFTTVVVKRLNGA